MTAPFDLFREEIDGKVLWIGIGATLEEAERKIADADKETPATYLIVSLKTGDQKIVPSKQSAETSDEWLNCRSAFA